MITNIKTDRFMSPMEILKNLGLEEGMQVADLGCGAGYFSIPAAKIVKEKGRVYAIDCLESALEAVRSKASIEDVEDVISLIRGNLEINGGTGITEDSINFVILKNVLSQSKKHKEILEETFRILLSGGRLLLIEWEPSKMPFGPETVNRINKEELIKLVIDVGFSMLNEFEADKYHYGIIFKK